jgi:hypothetical protein
MSGAALRGRMQGVLWSLIMTPNRNSKEKQIMSDAMPDAGRLRYLASWYREIAEKAGEPRIWYLRMCTARRLEKEAEQLEVRSARDKDEDE